MASFKRSHATSYRGTNILVSLQIGDANTEFAEQWYAEQSDSLAVSHRVMAGFIGHLGLRVRKGEVSERNASRILAAFDDTIFANLNLLTVGDRSNVMKMRRCPFHAVFGLLSVCEARQMAFCVLLFYGNAG